MIIDIHLYSYFGRLLGIMEALFQQRLIAFCQSCLKCDVHNMTFEIFKKFKQVLIIFFLSASRNHSCSKMASSFDLDGSKTEKERLLIHAIKKNDVQLADILLNEGTNPNIRHKKFGDLAIVIAAKTDNTELMECLLKHNADVNACSPEGTPLMIAASMHNEIMFKVLLNAGADVNTIDFVGNNVLMHLIEGNHQDLAHILLQTGKCKFDAFNSRGKTALHYAVHLDDIRMVQMLLEAGVNPEILGQSGESPLMCAQSKEVVDVLLEAGCDPKHTDGNGMPCLHYAIIHRNAEVANTLIHRGADVNLVFDDNGKTPLFFALIYWLPSTVEALVSHGADIAARDHQNRGAVYFVAPFRDPDICQYLITNGADPNVTALDGTTPIYVAVTRRNTAVAKVLLENNVRINAFYSYDGKMVTLLDIAISQHLEELSKLLYESGCLVIGCYPLSENWPPGVLSVLNKMRGPRSLLDSCRLFMWSHFGRGLSDHLDNFFVPKVIKDMLL